MSDKFIVNGRTVMEASQMAKNIALPLDDEYEIMQDQIDALTVEQSEIKDNLNTVSRAAILYPNWVTGHGGYVKKNNRIVEVQIVFNTNGDVTPTENYQFAIIPEGYRPKETISIQQYTLGVVNILPNGLATFSYNPTIPQTQHNYVHFTYLLD